MTLPGKIAAACLLLFAAVPIAAASDAAAAPAAPMLASNRDNPVVVVIRGGTGANRWELRYGTPSGRGIADARLLNVTPRRTYFANADWLRLIDADRGVVLGRWHMPGVIVSLEPAGGDRAMVECSLGGGLDETHQKMIFDPAAPPSTPIFLDRLFAARTPLSEVAQPFHLNWQRPLAQHRRSRETIQQLLPQVDDMLRRDPVSPMWLFAKGRLLQDLPDPAYRNYYQQAVDFPGQDFIELFRLSHMLDQSDEPELGKAAYELAYRDYIQRGFDPRLHSALITRLILYFGFAEDAASYSPSARDEVLEHVYRLQPWGEGTEIAWRRHADEIETAGMSARAAIWRERARQSAVNSLFVDNLAAFRLHSLLGGFVGFWLALPLFLMTLGIRYREQRLLDLRSGRAGLAVRLGFEFVYLSPRERAALVLLVFAGWYWAGLAAVHAMGMTRQSSLTMSSVSGSLAGEHVRKSLGRLPDSPERDLLLAMSLQQSGKLDDAERLYRRLPDFAEAWNNLGVLLRQTRRESDATQAFETALRLRPGFPEATFNLGRPVQDEWVEVHRKYLPGQPMLAPPTQAEMHTAVFGPRLWLRALAGPWAADPKLGWLTLQEGQLSLRALRAIQLAYTVLLAAVLLLPFAPRRDVTQSPPRLLWLWNLLLPGSAYEYGALGGIVMLVWLLLANLIPLAHKFTYGTPYFVADIAMPNLVRAFGLHGMDLRGLAPYLGLTWPWYTLALFALTLVNVGVVFYHPWKQRARARRAQAAAAR